MLLNDKNKTNKELPVYFTRLLKSENSLYVGWLSSQSVEVRTFIFLTGTGDIISMLQALQSL